MATATISTTVENSSSMQNVVKRSKKKRAMAFLKKLNILNPGKPKPKEGCILISEKELPKLIERQRRRRAKRSVGVNTDFEDVSSNLSIGVNTSNVSTLPEPDVPAKTLVNSSTQCSVSSSSIYDEDEDSQSFLDEMTFGWTMCAAIASTFAFLLYNMFFQPSVCELLLVLSIAAHIVCCGFLWVTNCRTFLITSGPDKDDKNYDSKLDMDSVEQLIQETKRQTVRHVIQILDSKGLLTNSTDSDVETKRSKSLGALSFDQLQDLWECCSECDAYIHEPEIFDRSVQ